MMTLIRHAESVANAGRRTFDPGTIGLTDAGVLQAEALAKSWGRTPSKLISSPFLRALDTAKPLATRFGLPIHVGDLQEFTYLSPDRCRGTTPHERRNWVDAYWQRAEPDFRDGTGAETFREFASRVEGAICAIGGSCEPGVVVVCHGQVIQMACWLVGRSAVSLDANAMREFRELDINSPVGHCEQRVLMYS
ncbi:histidine phosphatase family protein [Stenotrophomonas oahuensis]|uniref:histidine phosphatase family protein n=1 Tax=Stenotrophomonas oahuensis TaxID=3003271 RepID=UPI003CCE1F88